MSSAETHLEPVVELTRRLAKHPGIRFTATPTSVRIEAPTPEGFEVALHASPAEYVVSFDGWHEHFASAEEALDCIAFAFSGRSRLAVSYRGPLPVKWVLESFEDGGWRADSEVGMLLVPFWFRSRVEYRRNPAILASP